MELIVALVGRPNVGKSTLFNKLTKTRDALVANQPGLTRDRIYGQGQHADESYLLIDTGGLHANVEKIDEQMQQQTQLAIEEADVILLVVSAQEGLLPRDKLLAKQLRKKKKHVYVLVNKVDGQDPNIASAEFYALGFSKVYGVSAEHNKGVVAAIKEIISLSAPLALQQEPDSELSEPVSNRISVAIVGRPNVGKSTLVNKILGEERVVVFDQPGTTRDSVRVKVDRDKEKYIFIDTAGIRRKAKVDEAIEKFSVIKSLRAVEEADVALILVNAQDNITEQDLQIIGYVIDSGRPLVIVVNKWDGLSADHKDEVNSELDRRLKFVSYAKVKRISALHGSEIGNLFGLINEVYQSANQKFSTSKLNKILEEAVRAHAPPMKQGRRIKLRYAHLGGNKPFTIVIHGNQTSKLPQSYVQYLQNTYREQCKLVGVPIRITLKTSDNPYVND